MSDLRPGETDYRGLEQKLVDDDAISRQAWARACANVFALAAPSELLIEMATEGFGKFLLHARTAYQGHAFHFEDFKYMFEIIQRAAKDRQDRANAVLKTS
jgi:hypothetical protein